MEYSDNTPKDTLNIFFRALVISYFSSIYFKVNLECNCFNTS